MRIVRTKNNKTIIVISAEASSRTVSITCIRTFWTSPDKASNRTIPILIWNKMIYKIIIIGKKCPFLKIICSPVTSIYRKTFRTARTILCTHWPTILKKITIIILYSINNNKRIIIIMFRTEKLWRLKTWFNRYSNNLRPSLRLTSSLDKIWMR